MTHLLQVYDYLNQAMRGDSLLCLAQVVCWLDPLWQDDEYDVDDPMNAALSVTRRSFPDLYVEAIEKLRQGASDDAIEQIICKEISATGIPLDTLEHLAFGIPLPAYGAMLDDPEFHANHPDVLSVLARFGISPNPYQIDVPDCAYTAAEIIATDLASHPEEPYQQVGWLLRWLFSSTGNSICDWDYEIMCEIEPLTWEREDIDFARSMIEEADEVMGEVFAGLDWLTSQPAVLQALQDNVQRIYKAIEKQKGKNDEPRIRLSWSSFNSTNDDFSDSTNFS